MDVRIDPKDKRQALVTGRWTAQKYRLLRHYVDISKGPRLGWVDAAEAARRRVAKGPQGAAYIELFCGPGRICFEDTGEFADGSPLIAYDEAAVSGTAFTTVHLGDEREDFCVDVRARLESRSATVHTYPTPAELAAKQIVSKLNPYGLNFAFLDPFGLEGLPFSIIQTLGRFKRMDVLIYFSAESLQRNLPEWVKHPDRRCPLDDFAPDWRPIVKGMDPGDIKTRGKVFEHWLSLIKMAGFLDPDGKPPLIRGPNRQALYWLVLIAKHDLAKRFWKAVSKEDQGDLDF